MKLVVEKGWDLPSFMCSTWLLEKENGLCSGHFSKRDKLNSALSVLPNYGNSKFLASECVMSPTPPAHIIIKLRTAPLIYFVPARHTQPFNVAFAVWIRKVVCVENKDLVENFPRKLLTIKKRSKYYCFCQNSDNVSPFLRV